jgi:hypothetical protein
MAFGFASTLGIVDAGQEARDPDALRVIPAA